MRTPNDIAAAFADLVDVMLPGDDLFPQASAIGLQGLVAERLRANRGEEGIGSLLDALDACGGPLTGHDRERQTAIVARLEREHGALFSLLRAAAYLGYYEHPAVHEAIRALGRPYHAALLPKGYAVTPFDPAIDTPRHDRGGYVETAEVARVDLSGLDFLREASGNG